MADCSCGINFTQVFIALPQMSLMKTLKLIQWMNQRQLTEVVCSQIFSYLYMYKMYWLVSCCPIYSSNS